MGRMLKWAGASLAMTTALAATMVAWAWQSTDAALARRYAAGDRLDMRAAVRVAPVELGRHIVQVRNGCVDCHGASLGGKTIVDDGFIGTLRAPNITPSRLASWSDDEIAAAIRHGVGRDGRPLLVMPSYEYQHLSREDLAAVIAYLRSVPPVDTSPAGSTLGLGARLLYATGKLPTLVPAELVDHSRPFPPQPAEAPSIEFGRYLAASACAGCHGAQFRGGPIPGGPPEWAPAAKIRLGADPRWSRETFVETMRSGRSALDGRALRAPMPVALVSKLSDTELDALWRYLSTMR